MPESKKPKRLPTPAQFKQERDKLEAQGIGFQDVLQALALGVIPNAPRLPEQAYSGGQMFGGYQKGFAGYGTFKGAITFQMLRQIGERSPMLSAIIAKRLQQVYRYARVAQKSKKGEVGFRVVHKRDAEKDFNVPEGFKELCRACEEMLSRPWQVYWEQGKVYRDIEPTFGTFLQKVMEDLLVINRPAVELGLDPLGIPRAFGAIDGANLIPTFAAIKWLTKKAGSPYAARAFAGGWADYRQNLNYLSERYAVNITEKTEYIYVLSGKPVAAFAYGEVMVSPFMQTTDVSHAGYPRSLTERAIYIILSEIMAMTYNARYFENGSMAEIILAMRGNYTDPHVKELAAILQANGSGVQGAFRVPLMALPGGADDLNVLNLKQNHRDMLFDFYIQKLTNLSCAVFGMHPSEINEAPRAGDNAGQLQQSNQSLQIEMAQGQGLETGLLHVKSGVIDPILQRIHPDLCLEWDYGKNEATQLDIVSKYAGITTVNERRAMMSLDPIPDEEGGNVIDNQFIQARKQQEQMAEQMKAQQAAGGAGGAEGGGEGEGTEGKMTEGKQPGGGGVESERTPSRGESAKGGEEKHGNEGSPGRQQQTKASVLRAFYR